MKDDKTAGTIIVTIVVALVFTIIGVCFSSFLLPKRKIVIENVALIAFDGASFANEKNEKITSIKIEVPKTGLRPATGDCDAENHIPSTIKDGLGSEGGYVKFIVSADTNYKIILKNVKINKNVQTLEHVMIAFKDEEPAISLKSENAIIARGSNTKNETPKLYTLYLWVHADAQEKLVGAKISFDIVLVKDI
ncbi:MAG: hypothetical protein RR334_00080 [Clostridia bacterium]